MRSGQSARRTHQAVAILLSGFVALGSVPTTAYAAPPSRTPVRKPTRPEKTTEDPKRAEARKSYAEAEAKFQSGDFEAAFNGYKAANDAVPAPQTLYKMALCLDKLDKTTEALAAYGTFLSSNPPASMEAKTSEAQARVTDLKKKAPVIVKVRSDPSGAMVSLDGATQADVSPLDVKTTPGHHKFQFTSPGFDAVEKDVDVQPVGMETTVEAVLPKSIPVADTTPPPPPPTETKPIEKPVEPPPERRSNTAAYVVLGVAGAGAVVGTIFGIKALQGKSDFDNGAKTTDKADSVEKDALIADMALGAAITLGVTGTVLLLTNSGTSGDSATRSQHFAGFDLTPTLGAHRAGAAATFRF